jgi:radical SAM/Cys-rich protein
LISIELPILDPASSGATFKTELRAAPKITTLQINIGYRCNLACRHCHVESSPARTAPEENTNAGTAGKAVDWVFANPDIRTVDITGGSPELNPHFPSMVGAFSAGGSSVIERCNPTITEHVDPHTGEECSWIPAFLADHRVQVVASLPCYTPASIDHQRGRGSCNASVEGLRKLNAVGYGHDPELILNLVYNPDGPYLPPAQHALEADYKRELEDRYGLVFNELWTITNMPIGRRRHELAREGRLDAYLDLLIRSCNPITIDGLMCRHQISIDPQGRLYDCDFNQALRLPVPGRAGRRLWEYTASDLARRRIATADHCSGCTAGAGSSCGGALA